MIQGKVPGAVFVDFFSGSGGIGIEALSRGAKKAYFIDNNKQAYACIKENLQFTKLMDESMIINADACSAVNRITQQADIIFMDPPYDSGLDAALLSCLAAAPCVTEDTLIIVEAVLDRDADELAACGFTVEKEKKYKTNKHIFLYKTMN
jgi:16S rRNA (guanine966-N2)-methyltransferase